jgi:DNA-binding NtrC family response regulator
VVQEADGGSLFLDEVDCLPLGSQVKLLRFRQDKEFRPVESARGIRADVRVMAASNCDLLAAVRARDLVLTTIEGSSEDDSFRAMKARAVAQFERSCLGTLLDAHGGNISAAARAAKKNRRAFWELLRKHNLAVAPPAAPAQDARGASASGFSRPGPGPVSHRPSTGGSGPRPADRPIRP